MELEFMRGRIAVLLGVLMLAGAAAYGCADAGTTGPMPTPPSQALLTVPVEVPILQRTTPLLLPIRASARIGRQGGVVAIPAAGLAVAFPPNALSGTVTVTVTALPGRDVAYVFEPHGLRFEQPVHVLQSYRHTEAYRNPGILTRAEGAYFPNVLGLVGGFAAVTEFRPTMVDPATTTIRFTIDHFSGYITSSGRSSR